MEKIHACIDFSRQKASRILPIFLYLPFVVGNHYTKFAWIFYLLDADGRYALVLAVLLEHSVELIVANYV